MKFKIQYLILLLSFSLYSQSDIANVLKGGEILINGLSFLQSSKTEAKATDSKVIESLCVKNKLTEKITFSIVGETEDGDKIKKS